MNHTFFEHISEEKFVTLFENTTLIPLMKSIIYRYLFIIKMGESIQNNLIIGNPVVLLYSN